MLAATDDETKFITEYVASQARQSEIAFAQKVYSETIGGTIHDIWDVHTDEGRWWVITNPMTNLYSQEQFPNMDIALTFHLGMCIRVPRTEKEKNPTVDLLPFAGSLRQLSDAGEALSQAQELGDYQAIGVRCRETLLAFTDAAQEVFPWASSDDKPKRADFKAWVDHICGAVLPGASHENRRALFKAQLDAAWKFANWLTHARGAAWYDAEAAISITENALTICVSTIYRLIRDVPEQCPNCRSSRLRTEHAENPEEPDEVWERPSCAKCGWHGTATLHKASTRPPKRKRMGKIKGECTVQTVPLRKLKKP